MTSRPVLDKEFTPPPIWPYIPFSNSWYPDKLDQTDCPWSLPTLANLTFAATTPIPKHPQKLRTLYYPSNATETTPTLALFYWPLYFNQTCCILWTRCYWRSICCSDNAPNPILCNRPIHTHVVISRALSATFISVYQYILYIDILLSDRRCCRASCQQCTGAAQPQTQRYNQEQ
jgi:hypothetical protein